MEGRTYRYFRGEPLYPFGHGLSYTTFEYSNLAVSRPQVAAGECVDITLRVTNTGPVAGDEVVQLYVRRPDLPAPQPVKEMEGLKRVGLQPGESKAVTFALHADQLACWDEALGYAVWPGVVEVMIGSSSADIRLSGEFEITGPRPVPVRERTFACLVQLG